MPTRTKKKTTTRRGRTKSKTLRLPALEICQGKNRRLYSFAVDGKQLHEFCTISRVSRTMARD